jgi:hypothetical protein
MHFLAGIKLSGCDTAKTLSGVPMRLPAELRDDRPGRGWLPYGFGAQASNLRDSH